jgi:hypothetical protein
MSGTQRPTHDTSSDAHAHGRSRAAQGVRRRGRRTRRDTGADTPLRLLPARTRPMSSEQEQRLVVSLGELIVELIEGDPGGLDGLRTRPRSDLDGCSRAKEQP